MRTSFSTPALRALWAAVKQNNDTSALEELMKRVYPVMFGYGLRLSRDGEFVQDCIQDVFITIWQHRETLVVPDSPKSYLLTSLRRKMINNGAKGHWVSLDTLCDFDLQHDLSPDHLVFGQEELDYQIRLVDRLLSGLSDRQREAVYLRYYQNLSRTEIAAVMNISEQSVSNILQKALHSLRKSWPVGVGHILSLCIWVLFFA